MGIRLFDKRSLCAPLDGLPQPGSLRGHDAALLDDAEQSPARLCRHGPEGLRQIRPPRETRMHPNEQLATTEVTKWISQKVDRNRLRVQLEKIYENMGGKDLDPDAGRVLNNLQKKLNAVLDKLAGQFVLSLEPNIQEKVKKLGELISGIKGAQLQKSQVSAVR